MMHYYFIQYHLLFDVLKTIFYISLLDWHLKSVPANICYEGSRKSQKVQGCYKAIKQDELALIKHVKPKLVDLELNKNDKVIRDHIKMS